MVLLDAANFKNLHADMSPPTLKMAHVELYLANREKRLDKKATSLYHNSYVSFVRCCVAEKGAFFKAEVRAEMKVGVVYKVDICVSFHCVILECQCQYAPGMGPHVHCKHVNCVCMD